MLMMLAELKKPKQPRKGMTTEELADAVIATVSQMSELEKAKVRQAIRGEFRKPDLYKRVQ